MSIQIAYVCALMLVGAASIQLLIAALFRKRFVSTCQTNREREQVSPSESVAQTVAQTASILMSLRGNDPSLRGAIEGALSQEYAGQYDVRVVVDHESDPAAALLEELQQSHPHGSRLSVSTMEAPLKTCSLKCHSLAQAVSSLPPEVEYIAMLDADVRPHPTWLAELTAPLRDDVVGGVTGTQWFEPAVGSGVGTWLRSVWNGGATILTIHFANPWAGSFAMRRSDLLASGLIERWQRSMVDDGPIRAAVQSIDKQIRVAPSLVMVNGEHCTLGYTVGWAARMLTWSRLYEPTFWITILHALLSNLVMLVNVAVLVAGLFGGLPPTVIWVSLAALIIAGVQCAAAFRVARSCVGESAKLRGESLLPLAGRHWLWAFALAAPAHLMFGWGCLVALTTKQIAWRGIEYRLKSGGEVERLGYRPFVDVRAGEDKAKAGHSI